MCVVVGEGEKKVSVARASARALYFFLFSHLYFSLRVLTWHVGPFEGALVPREKGPGAQNLGPWYPKLSAMSDFAAFPGECSSNGARAPLWSRLDRHIPFVLGPGTPSPRWPSPLLGEVPRAGRQLPRVTKPVAVAHA